MEAGIRVGMHGIPVGAFPVAEIPVTCRHRAIRVGALVAEGAGEIGAGDREIRPRQDIAALVYGNPRGRGRGRTVVVGHGERGVVLARGGIRVHWVPRGLDAAVVAEVPAVRHHRPSVSAL